MKDGFSRSIAEKSELTHLWVTITKIYGIPNLFPKTNYVQKLTNRQNGLYFLVEERQNFFLMGNQVHCILRIWRQISDRKLKHGNFCTLNQNGDEFPTCRLQ